MKEVVLIYSLVQVPYCIPTFKKQFADLQQYTGHTECAALKQNIQITNSILTLWDFTKGDRYIPSGQQNSPTLPLLGLSREAKCSQSHVST